EFRRVRFRSGLTGRAKALSQFTVAAGTASVATPPTGTNPIAFELAPLGNDSPKNFTVGADFPVAGDDSGLATGAGANGFYVYVVDAVGLQLASATGSG